MTGPVVPASSPTKREEFLTVNVKEDARLESGQMKQVLLHPTNAKGSVAPGDTVRIMDWALMSKFKQIYHSSLHN